MKTITLIFISVIALASSHFLRELDPAALTVTATTFPKTCVSSFTGTTLEADFTGTAAATATGYTTTATLKKDALTVDYTCTALTATSKKLECSYSSGESAATDGDYKLETVVEAKAGASPQEPANTFTVGSTAKTAVIKKNANYLPLKSYTASSQTIDYKKDEPHFFTLTYSANIGTASKPSKVKAGTKEFTTACTATEAVLNCTVTKETLPVGNYTVTVVNACELDEDTKVSLVVVEGASSILSFSKYLVLVLGLFLF